MPKTVNVLYDISILGRAHLDARSRTGIFRVIESVFSELIDHQYISLLPTSLHGTGSFWDYYASQLYLHHIGSEQALRSFVDFYEKQIPLYGLRTWAQRYLIKDSQKNRGIASRGIRYLIANSCKLFDVGIGGNEIVSPKQKHDNRFIPFDLNSIDIYHSPFLSIPDQSHLPVSIPRIITVYDLIPVIFPNLFTRSQLESFRKSLYSINVDRDWILCISESTKHDLLVFFEGKLDPSRVVVTPLAAANVFLPINDTCLIRDTLINYGIPIHRPYLLTLCTLEPRKNLAAVIRAFVSLIRQNLDCDLNLVLVGIQGWKNKSIFDEINKSEKLKSRIFFTGFVPDQDLSAIYSGATCFVYPSLYEGFGLPPLEAMQCGVPVITSNVSSLPEVVGDAGMMVSPKDEEGLCRAIYRVASDQSLRASLAVKSLERAQQFSWSRCAQQTIQLYAKAAAAR
jgi:glycosyltransferase involved in cell wall biosynthesis